jgi:hypothetical protein
VKGEVRNWAVSEAVWTLHYLGCSALLPSFNFCACPYRYFLLPTPTSPKWITLFSDHHVCPDVVSVFSRTIGDTQRSRFH